MTRNTEVLGIPLGTLIREGFEGRSWPLSKGATYAAANAGQIPTVRLGVLRLVPSSWLRTTFGPAGGEGVSADASRDSSTGREQSEGPAEREAVGRADRVGGWGRSPLGTRAHNRTSPSGRSLKPRKK